jgi:putative ABC transport system permease protein
VPTALPIAEVPSLDLRVLALALGLTTLTGIGIGVWPAWRAGGVTAMHALRDGARAGSSRGRERLRSVLAVVEVAVSVALLVVCALLLNSFLRLQGVDPGYKADGVMTLRTWLPLPKYDQTQRREQFFDRVLSDVRTLPGVTGAAYVSFTPLTFKGGVWPVAITGRVSNPDNDVRASLRVVTPGYFSTLQIPLRQGRDFEAADQRNREPVAIISQSFAETYWPGESPLGRTFDLAFQLRTVVGVVGDVRVRGLEPAQESEPQAYLPHAQMADGSLSFYVPIDLIVRAGVDPLSILPAVRRAVAGADPLQPVSDVALLSDIVSRESAPREVQLRVVAAFGLTALLLAVVGIYGVLAFGVTQRTHEFGVRLALGAQPSDIVRLVLRHTAALSAAGVIAGLALGYVASRSIESLLVGTAPANLPAYLAVAALAGVTALAAGLIPARRAARVGATLVIRG